MKYLLIILGLAITSVIGYTGYTMKQANDRLVQSTTELAKVHEQLVEASRTVAELKTLNQSLSTAVHEIAAKHQDVSTGQKQVIEELNGTRLYLESHIGRTKAIEQRPGVVQKKIRESYSKFAAEFECSTGVKGEQCKN